MFLVGWPVINTYELHISQECLFFFVDRVVNNFLRGKVEGRMAAHEETPRAVLRATGCLAPWVGVILSL